MHLDHEVDERERDVAAVLHMIDKGMRVRAAEGQARGKGVAVGRARAEIRADLCMCMCEGVCRRMYICMRYRRAAKASQ